MEFSKLKAEYIPSAAALERASLGTAWSAEQIRASLGSEDTLYLVAVERGEVCASVSCVFSAYEGLVANLVVAPAYRRRGLASALLALVGDEARKRGVERLCLEVAVTNAAAIALYEKALFRNEGIKRGGVGQGGDVRVMTKEVFPRI